MYCCILSWQIKGNTVPISAIWHRSSRELCHYLDTGIVWPKWPKAHPPILSGQIKGNTVPISAIWHRSSRALCHYLDTGIVWPKPIKYIHDFLCIIKRFSWVWVHSTATTSIVETSCPIKEVMCTRKRMHKECNKSVVTQLTRVHIGYIGSVVPLPSRPVALGPKPLLSQYIPCGTRACVTTITNHIYNNYSMLYKHSPFAREPQIIMTD